MSVRIQRPPAGSIVTAALCAAAGGLAVAATTRFEDGVPLTASRPALGIPLAVLAVVAMAAGAVRVARTPATVPLLHRPWLAFTGLVVAASPWLRWARTPESQIELSGWLVLGTAACCVAVAGGALLAVLAALPARRWHATVPIAVAAALLSGWLRSDTLDFELLVTAPEAGIAIGALLVAAVLAVRDPGGRAAAAMPLAPGTLILAVGGIALLAAPTGLWQQYEVIVIGGGGGGADFVQDALPEPLSGWSAAPMVAALATAVGLAAVVIAARRARTAGGLGVRSVPAALIAAGGALASSAWLPWWDGGFYQPAWETFGFKAWAVAAGGALVATGAAQGLRRSLLPVVAVCAAIVLTDGVWRAEDALPPTGGALLALGAAVLVCAVLLRPAEDGGTL